ncbi:protein PROCA1 [Bombina bombina]|uniref:protein PROCA1 n=1 Tax=Bombina bombina TaxID=8345 RepID=UPI00235ABD79|nr:protein PROCA1 [Bombina bombina]
MWVIPSLLLISVMCGVMGVLGKEGSLGDEHCALISSQHQYTVHQVTDGMELVTATWDERRQLVSCTVDGDNIAISYFLQQCKSDKQNVGGDMSYEGFAEARMRCEIFQRSASVGVQAYSMDNTDTYQHHRAKRGFTYPGTLWCGAGNSADAYTDLGEHKETDACCREHDHCAHVIHPFTSSYGYRNFRWHTISLCQCDDKFKECLRRVNNTASRVVGQAFFNVIQVPCFELTFKEHCVERYWYGWCKKYENTEIAVAKESGLYDYGGQLIEQVSKEKDKNVTPTSAVELSPEKPTLGQVIQATEDLLKLVMTVSPSTSDMSKVETTTKKKEKKKEKKKKDRKQKKGKGLKGKKKNQLKSEDVKSPAKDIWTENVVKNEGSLLENHPLDSITYVERKQNIFNDVLNDEPPRNAGTTPQTYTVPITPYQEFKHITPPLPHTVKPHSERPLKNKKERKGRRHKKRKPKTEPFVSEILR